MTIDGENLQELVNQAYDDDTVVLSQVHLCQYFFILIIFLTSEKIVGKI